ncbi:MAG: PAS-domain containing protein [Rhodoferax sp.]|nr:PAS-domain containing protein [Rhodoferax sp.]MCF8209790.1 PAS-domain containing protein [Rhodoferax sp.]
MDSETSAFSDEKQQLELMQRVGRVGYWEYDAVAHAMHVPSTSLGLLRSISGSSDSSAHTLLDVLSDIERSRLQKTLEHAALKRLDFNVEFKVDNPGLHCATIIVRGAPLMNTASEIKLAGTFHDISHEKRIESEREEVITQLQSLLDVLPQGVSVIDKDLRLILWNKRFQEILDFPQSLVHRYALFEDFIRYNAQRGEYGPGNPEDQVQAQVALARKFETHRFERNLTGGGTVQVEGFPFKFGGSIYGFVTIYSDVTEAKRTESQLIRQRDIMKTVIENFPGAISLFDADLKMAACNEQFKSLLDMPEHLFAKSTVHFEDLIRFNANRGEYGPGDAEQLTLQITERARNFTAHRIERERPGGQWLEIRGTPIPSGGFVTSYIDITERKKAEERIRVLALQDTLTGLPNRLHLNDQVEQALERAASTSRQFALLFLDLDGFKRVNDTHGHDIGDVLLIHVAKSLKKAVHETDVVARLGGDEFVVLLQDIADKETVASIAEKIVNTIAEPCTLEGIEVKIGTSVGIAIYPKNGTSREVLLKVADHAMYEVKSSGKGNYRFSD